MIHKIAVWCRTIIVVLLMCYASAEALGSDDHRIVVSTTRQEAENSNEALEQEKKVGLRVFTTEDSGKEHHISVGEEFHVRLWENPTTGYLWSILDPISPHLKLIDSKFIPGNDVGRVGSGGERIFVFRTVQPGCAMLRMALRRPWEKKGTEAGSYSIKLTIATTR